MKEDKIRKETVETVNRYLTPLAIIIVLSAIIFSEPREWDLLTAVVLHLERTPCYLQ